MQYQREFERRIRTAVIGIGSHTYRNLLPALNYLPVELAAVVNHSNEEEGRRTAAQYGCAYYKDREKMYEEIHPEAVIICTGPKSHPALVLDAFSHGCDVFFEKPAALNQEDILKMIDAQGDRICINGLKKVYQPCTTKALEIMADEKYGKPLSIMGNYPIKLPKDPIAAYQQGIETDLHKNGCHPLSFMTAVAGPAEAVTLHQIGESGSLVIEYKNGILGTLLLSSGPQPNENYALYGSSWTYKVENGVEIRFNRGMPFEYGRTESFIPDAMDTYGTVLWEPQFCKTTLENKSLFIQGVYQELLAFYNAVLDREQPYKCSLPFVLEVQKIIDAALLSCGQRVVIE